MIGLAAIAPPRPAIARAAKGVTRAWYITLFGPAKFAKGLDHLPYANPAAPKGGTLVLGGSGGFDSLNEFALKGNAAPGLSYMTDSLTIANAEEPRAHYCLVCDWMEYPADRGYIVFHVNPMAKFQDGSPITAADVAFSFEALTKGLPQYKNYYADVLPPVVVDRLTIKFPFKAPGNELPVIVGEMPVLSKAYWSKEDIGKTTLKPPVGSGPYRIESFETGRSITFARHAGYWARDLPMRRGFYNFARIRIDNYNDAEVALEAFKGGAIDYQTEAVSKNWQLGYECEGLRRGQLKKELVKEDLPQGFQGFAFNTRREIFRDVRVREALSLVFDFEWMNKNLFYGAYRRTESYFENSPMAARGRPEGAELKILKGLGDRVPPRAFTEPFRAAINATDADRRDNLRRALKLLGDAGWTLADGKLRNAKGAVFDFEFLLDSPAFERVVLAYRESLAKIGVTIRVRRVDAAQYVNRVRDFDFDMMTDRQGEGDTPGNEQRGMWGAAAAREKGTRNLVGAVDPALDRIIAGLVAATSIEGLAAHVKALDRVLLWGFYHVPNWYFPFARLAYWDKFGRPAVAPPRGLTVDTWWIDPAKDAALAKARG